MFTPAQNLFLTFEIIANEFCFNKSIVLTPTTDRRIAGSGATRHVLAHTWKSKETKALFRNTIKDACLLSKAFYARFAKSREQMMYRTIGFGPKRKGLPILPFTTKCDCKMPSASDVEKDEKGAQSFRALNIRRLHVITFASNSRYKIPELIPANITSLRMDLMPDLRIEKGTLPDSLIDLSICTVEEVRTYYLPPNLVRLNWTNEHEPDIPWDWPDTIMLGMPETLKALLVDGVPIGCAGCERCVGSNPVDKTRFKTTRLPSQLQEISIFVRTHENRTVAAKLCAIPSTVVHMIISTVETARYLLRFDNCAFPLLRSLYVRGYPTGFDSMIKASNNLPSLILASVVIFAFLQPIPNPEISRALALSANPRNGPYTGDPYATKFLHDPIPVRVSDSLALSLLSKIDCAIQWPAKFCLDVAFDIWDRFRQGSCALHLSRPRNVADFDRLQDPHTLIQGSPNFIRMIQFQDWKDAQHGDERILRKDKDYLNATDVHFRPGLDNLHNFYRRTRLLSGHALMIWK